MKKLYVLSLLLLALCGCSFQFNSSSEKEQTLWEYKEITMFGKVQKSNSLFSSNVENTKTRDFPDVSERLNNLGKEGWELVGMYTTQETVFPNFGNEDYHTGIKTNTRTKEVVFILKRPLKIQEKIENVK